MHSDATTAEMSCECNTLRLVKEDADHESDPGPSSCWVREVCLGSVVHCSQPTKPYWDGIKGNGIVHICDAHFAEFKQHRCCGICMKMVDKGAYWSCREGHRTDHHCHSIEEQMENDGSDRTCSHCGSTDITLQYTEVEDVVLNEDAERAVKHLEALNAAPTCVETRKLLRDLRSISSKTMLQAYRYSLDSLRSSLSTVPILEYLHQLPTDLRSVISRIVFTRRVLKRGDIDRDDEQKSKLTDDLRDRLREIPEQSSKSGRVVHSDLSIGREPFPVRVVNDIDDAVIPSSFVYSTDVVDSDGVMEEMAKDEEKRLMMCCDCADVCLPGACPCSCDAYCQSEEGVQAKPDRLQYPIAECGAACACSTRCGNRLAQCPSSYPVEIFRTENGRGWGLRAASAIPHGAFIALYTGELKSDVINYNDDTSYQAETYLGETNIVIIDALHMGNISRFINHSCAPNAMFQRVSWDPVSSTRLQYIGVFATRPIDNQEEITIDYGPKYWRSMEFACLCGSFDCKYNEKKSIKRSKEMNNDDDQSIIDKKRKRL